MTMKEGVCCVVGIVLNAVLWVLKAVLWVLKAVLWVLKAVLWVLRCRRRVVGIVGVGEL